MNVKQFASLGGKARAKRMTKAERVAAAKHAIGVRWAKYRAAHYGKKAKS